MPSTTLTGEVVKAYSPSRKSGYSKFFFVVEDHDLGAIKGMARADPEFLDTIVLGNVVEMEGNLSREWMNPSFVRVIREKEVAERVETFEVGHVGHPKPTRYGEGFYAKVGPEEWLVIPTAAAWEFFEGGARPATSWEFPRRGRGTLRAKVKRNGSVVVTEILDWTPLRRDVDLTVPFRNVWWEADHVEVPGPSGRIVIGADQLPFELEREILPTLKRMDAALHVVATVVAVSRGLDRIEWEVEQARVVVDGDLADRIRSLVWNDRIAKATAAVREEMRELLSQGVVVDLSKVVDLFLSQGVVEKDARLKAEEVWTRGYDGRYLNALRALQGDGDPVWKTTDGFILQVGKSLVWERCVPGAATYIVPAKPHREIAGHDLSTEEWASVLGRILPEVNKMDLRYGPLGQSLAGTEEGVQFAFHVEDDDGEFPGWVDAVRAAVERDQTPRGTVQGLPTLDDILALTA